MEVLNYTEFRKNLAKSLDMVNDDAETVIVSRSKGKNVVVMRNAKADAKSKGGVCGRTARAFGRMW